MIDKAFDEQVRSLLEGRNWASPEQVDSDMCTIVLTAMDIYLAGLRPKVPSTPPIPGPAPGLLCALYGSATQHRR